jgi:hypothetical protein
MSKPVLALVVNLRSDADELVEHLRANRVPPLRDKAYTDFRTIEWKLKSATASAELALMQYRDTGNLACLFFSGEQAAEVAIDLALLFHYVPVDALHQLVRRGTSVRRRKAYLRVLGQAHMKIQPGDVIDTRMARTLSAVSEDEEPSVRLDAALTALVVDRVYAGALVTAMLAREAEPATRSALTKIIGELRTNVIASPAIAPSSDLSGEVSVGCALAGAIADTMAIFESGLEVTASAKDGDFAVIEAKAAQVWDARMVAVADEAAGCGCVHFRRRDAAALAMTASGAFHFLPLELTLRASREATSPELRGRACRAMAMQTSSKFIESPIHDPEVDRALLAAQNDDDPGVAEAVRRTLMELRPELLSS